MCLIFIKSIPFLPSHESEIALWSFAWIVLEGRDFSSGNENIEAFLVLLCIPLHHHLSTMLQGNSLQVYPLVYGCRWLPWLVGRRLMKSPSSRLKDRSPPNQQHAQVTLQLWPNEREVRISQIISWTWSLWWCYGTWPSSPFLYSYRVTLCFLLFLYRILKNSRNQKHQVERELTILFLNTAVF